MASSPPRAPKKPRMSSDDDAESPPSSPTSATQPDPGQERRPRYKRRKVAIFLGYCGAGYQGMQKNPGARTIEGDLEEALFLAGAVPEADRAVPRRYDWARAARTDKGVSAAAQVVSGRFYIDPPGLVARLNSHLPDQIRVFGYSRVTNSFNAKRFCDRRRYVYLLPIFALDPSAHPDRESVLASAGTGNELARCLECSERGRKVAGLVGRHPKLSSKEEEGSGSAPEFALTLESQLYAGIDGKKDDQEGGAAENGVNELKPRDQEVPIEEKSVLENPASGVKEETEKLEQAVRSSEFRYGEKEKERFNAILKRYVGTHNFHNFTTRTKAEDPSARRFIISFEAEQVVVLEGMEFIKCIVVGQSFMLHQIRKMIGLAVGIMRNCGPESLMDVALRKDVSINVPTAPEVGLYLDECLFTSYNEKWKDSHEVLSMEAYAEQAEELKMKHIYSHIASMELKEGAVALWLHSLNHRNYPDFHFMETKGQCANAEPRTNAT